MTIKTPTTFLSQCHADSAPFTVMSDMPAHPHRQPLLLKKAASFSLAASVHHYFLAKYLRMSKATAATMIKPLIINCQ